MLGELDVDSYITNVHQGLENINLAIDNLHKGECLRDIV